MNTVPHTPAARPTGGRARDLTYDWLRLIATLCVVVGHGFYTRINEVSGGVYYTLPENLHPAYTSTVWQLVGLVSGWVYDFHMPLFFILSGAVLALRPTPPPGRVITGKAKRLLLPYVVCGFVFMLPVKYLAGFYDGPGLAAAYKGFLLGSDTGHLWFLPALFWCMVIFVLLQKASDRLGKWQMPVLLAVAAGLTVLVRFTTFDVFLLFRGIGYLFWFALGWVFQQLRSRCRPARLWVWLAVLAALLALEYANMRWDILGDAARVLAGSALCYVLAQLCARLLTSVSDTRLWQALVAGSMAIYLYHDPLEYLALRIFFEGGLLTTAIGCHGYYLTRIVGVIVVSLLIDLLVRQVKKGFRKPQSPAV